MTLRGHTHSPTQNRTLLQILVVGHGQYCLGLPAEAIRGIEHPEETDGDGSVTMLGNTYSRLELPPEFGLTRHPTTPEARVVLCARGSVCIALGVDRVFGLEEIDAQTIQPLPLHFTGSEREWIAGLFRFQDQLALSINPEWLLKDHGEPRQLNVSGESSLSPALLSQNSGEAAGRGEGSY